MSDGKLDGTDDSEKFESPEQTEQNSAETREKNYETAKDFLTNDKKSDGDEGRERHGVRNQILLTPEDNEKSKRDAEKPQSEVKDTADKNSAAEKPKPEDNSNEAEDTREGNDLYNPEKMSADEKIMDSQRAVERSKSDVEEAKGLDKKFQQVFDEPKSRARTAELQSIRSQNNHELEHLSSRRQALETGLSGYQEKKSETAADPDNPQYRYLTDKVNEYRDSLHDVDWQIYKLKENNKRIDEEVGAEKPEKKSASDTVRDFFDKFRKK